MRWDPGRRPQVLLWHGGLPRRRRKPLADVHARAWNGPVASGNGIRRVARESFGIDELLVLVTRLPREEQWDALARGALRDDLYATLQTLTRSVLAREGDHPQAQLEEWSREHDESLERVRAQLSGIRQLARPGIAALSVALRTLRSVTR